VRLEGDSVGSYFTSNKEELEFVSSGCELLNCVLGGGYVLGRMTNIVGDKSTAKTALACEAVTNFLLKFKKATAKYRDVEAAFDIPYAEAMGLPIDRVDFGESNVDGDPIEKMNTVEDFYRDLDKFLDQGIKTQQPGVYVLDSLDALSDEAEVKRDIGEDSYSLTKQKQLGVMFRKLTRKLEKCRVLLIIISQTRDNIGVSFGEKQKRSGGKAMDFYASQILWLSHLGQIKKTKNRVERVIGINVRAKCKKNKVGLPLRQCDFNFIFGFGVDDIGASIDWLESTGYLDEVELSKAQIKKYKEELETLSTEDYQEELQFVSKKVKRIWNEIETSFLPKRKKY
jgi:recombination protein RecA